MVAACCALFGKYTGSSVGPAMAPKAKVQSAATRRGRVTIPARSPCKDTILLTARSSLGLTSVPRRDSFLLRLEPRFGSRSGRPRRRRGSTKRQPGLWRLVHSRCLSVVSICGIRAWLRGRVGRGKDPAARHQNGPKTSMSRTSAWPAHRSRRRKRRAARAPSPLCVGTLVAQFASSASRVGIRVARWL